jgi:hypothetical protein
MKRERESNQTKENLNSRERRRRTTRVPTTTFQREKKAPLIEYRLL